MKKYLIIGLIVIETLGLIVLYFYGLTMTIKVEKTVYEMRLKSDKIELELRTTQQQLAKVKKELENCR